MNHDAFEFVEASGGIEAYRLPANGLDVLLLNQAAAPVVTFMVTYRVGSRNEVPGHTGATHFLEHLMFKGTERFNKRRGTSVFNVLQRVGAQVNATTWLDRTNYYELLPREHLALAVEIEADRMRGALIDPDEMERERTVILNEFDRGQNEPMRNLYHAVWSAAFVAHPYHHPTIGWRSDIETVTPGGLRHYYDTFYWPNNATLSIIGDFDPAEALDLVARHFGPIPASPAPIPEVRTREPEQRGERRLIVRQAGQLGMLMVAFKAPAALEADTDALNVLATILTAGKGSRLYRRLTDAGLTTSVFAATSRLRDPGLFYLFASLAPGHGHADVEAVLLNELETIKDDGVSEDEVRRAQRQLHAQEAFGRDGPFSVASQLNEAIAAGDWTLYTTYLDRIRRVTPEAVQQVARTYLLEDRRTVGWYVPI
ncbi:MAG: insulinase family protein [Bacteroidetes bacterium]|nr:MAG: insulinase family protein [Bacteroidota bacterium]